MDACKHCGSEDLKKDGVRIGVQKWRCGSCNRSQGLTDNRIKYIAKERSLVLTLYLEGNGFRRIARILSEMFEKFFRWQTIV
jgi:transposase-like protein